MENSEVALYIAKITSVEEMGVSYSDDLYPNSDTNPDRTLIKFEPVSCSKAAFIEALYSTMEGRNFVHTSEHTLIDIGGSRLALVEGKQIVIYSDLSVTN
ncbi:hypothetical protein [Shewanella sp. UCD-KL12]|uniref:hypothetical protein n=1 Tax=Shewanella sp. UCD-KL12 TaxID=1917163 RepID=UPI0009710FF3|nr:hypothetical protein [Shewanella sp. UCD-KL12]